jgi:hypothetical protein
MNKNGRFRPSSIEGLQETKGASVDLVESGRGVELSGETKSIPVFDDNNKLRIPKEYSLQDVSNGSGNGRFELLDQNGDKVTEFKLNADGTLTPKAIANLEKAGLKVEDTVTKIKSTETITSGTPEDLLWTTADQTENVRRTLWYGNDTSGIYDKNELRAHAGGINGDWYDAQGNVVIDVTAMQPDGSYWDSQSANPWQLADDNKLKAGISLSKGTQDFVYDFNIERTPEGRLLATIPKDSPAHQLFEPGNQNNGHGDFNGRYI